LWPFFGAKMRVAVLLLVVGVAPTGDRDAGKFTADAAQLPTGCQPESLAKPARRRSHKATQPQLLTRRASSSAQVMSKWGQQSIDANPDMMKAYRRARNLEPLSRFCFPTAVDFDPKTDRIIVADSQRNAFRSTQGA
jgi:hypothetical protein